MDSLNEYLKTWKVYTKQAVWVSIQIKEEDVIKNFEEPCTICEEIEVSVAGWLHLM